MLNSVRGIHIHIFCLKICVGLLMKAQDFTGNIYEYFGFVSCQILCWELVLLPGPGELCAHVQCPSLSQGCAVVGAGERLVLPWPSSDGAAQAAYLQHSTISHLLQG